MKACVIGLGNAGLPLAAAISDAGVEVIGYDIDKKRVRQINSGINPITEEGGLGEIMKRNCGKTLYATSDIKSCRDARVYIVLVPLLLDKKHKPDFSILKAAFKDVASVLKDDDLVILETTVPPGTTEDI
ncbi:MAG: nucleotide sugar dehydrogenase, partial [Candidatus Altiarchaeota archaeon]|nr:nucleotide sugar dehydrogenase [Candidatus Altiarchaeota archaeon]